MNVDYNILSPTIDNTVVVSEYLECEKQSNSNNRALLKSITFATSLVICGSTPTMSVPIEPSFVNVYNSSTTELVKNQSDYIDFYIQQVNKFSTPLVVREDLVNEILSFKSLKENWDGYGAVPLEIKSASNALNILNKLDNTSISKVNEIYPNPHG